MARRDIDRLQGEIEELFADLWQVPRFSGLRHGFRPAVDCFVTDDPHQLVVVVELAGVDPESIEIGFAERTLTISGQRARPRVEGQVYQQAEIDVRPLRAPDPARTRHRARLGERDLRGRHAPDHAADRQAGLARPGGRDRRPQDRMSTPERMRLPVLPLKETVVFPESMTPLAVGQERSVKLIDDVVSGERMLALITVRNPEADPPGWDDLYRVGTVAVVHKMIKVPDGTLRILVQGLQRVRLVEPEQEEPYLTAELEELPDVLPDSPEVEALTRNVQAQFAHIIGMTPYLPEELQLAAANVDDPSALCHLIASTLRLKTDERQELLETVNVEERLRAVSLILNREVEMSELGSKIQSQVASEIDKGQREFFLRQQLKAIQDELGEGDEQQAEINELRGLIEEKKLPEHALKAADPRARAAREAPARGRRVRRHPHLSRLDHLAALERADHGRPRPRPRPPDPRRGPLRPREGEGADHRVPRRLEAEERPLRPDPLLRRAAGRRQDLARALDRPLGRPASSRGSPSAASATSPRSAGTAAPTSARCPARSSARSATPSRAIPSS